MSQPVGAMAPVWLDSVIDGAMDSGDPKVIAQAIASSPQFIAAIKRGQAKKLAPGMVGPTPAQFIRQEVIEALQAV